jgi:hypothetical protein
MCTQEQLKAYDWKSFNKLTERMPCPSSGGRPWFEAACPIDGGENRLRIYPDGDGKGRGDGFMHCRTCGCHVILAGGTRSPNYFPPVAPPKPLNTDFGKIYHAQLTPNLRTYFHSRGISDRWIDNARLGWTAKLRKSKTGDPLMPRWSIPCYDTAGQLWAVQYRHRDAGYVGRYKYMSETGGSNLRLFVPALYVLKALPYVVVTESPLDALTLCSHGIPAFAPFSGNNSSVAWRKEWSHWLPETVIVSVQADGGKGEEIGLARAKQIGRGTLLKAAGGKDESDMYRKGVDLIRWVKMPVIPALKNGTLLHDSHTN